MDIDRHLSVTKRRKNIEKELGISLPHIASFSLDETQASTQHCENMIGATQVPLGVAGPLKISTKQYFVPLATTEGALVASVNRGCKTITQSGGANVDISSIGATRGPVFYISNLNEGKKFEKFLFDNQNKIKEIAQSTSSHLILKKILTHRVGQYQYIRFVYDTKDAMGLNMVTIATDKVVKYLEDKTHLSCITLSGNYCVDKKPSWLNFIEGRGTKVWAEVLLPESVIKETLKTSAQKIYDVWLSKCMIGSIVSGSMGNNAQFANILGALFLATGQDIAHISECSLGITTTEVRGKDLYISVYLPDIMVGTVGGGTKLATQKEALEIMGISGGNKGKNSQLFSKILAATVLAGEISLLASLSVASLSSAHQCLARGVVK